MADRRAHARVEAGLQGRQAAANLVVVALVETLEQMKAHVVAAHRRKSIQRKAIAGGRQRLAEQQQAVADHLDHARRIVDPGVGRQRQVGQQQAGQVALLPAAVEIQSGFACAHAACLVDGKAHAGVDVEIAAGQLGAQASALSGQRLKLLAQPLGRRAQGLRQRARFGIAREQHLQAAMRGLQALLAAIPFRQQDAVGQHQVVVGLGRQVEVEAHPAGGAVVVVGDAEDVEVVGRFACMLVFVLVERAVDLDELGPGKQAFGTKQQHERVLRLRHLDPLGAPLAPFLVGRGFGARLRRFRAAGLALLPRVVRRLRVQPQRHRQRRLPAGLELPDRARLVQRRANRGFSHAFLTAQAIRMRTQCEQGLDQLAITPRQTGQRIQGGARRLLVAHDPRRIRRNIVRGEREQPQVQFAVLRALRKDVERGRQVQRGVVGPGQFHLVADACHAFHPAAARAMRGRGAGAQRQAGIAAQRAEEDRRNALDLLEFHARLGKAAIRATGDQPVPQAADEFFHG